MINTKNLLKKEQSYVPITASITVACSITGFVTYLFSNHSIWQQWSVLFHLLTGIAASIALAPYLAIHFSRTLGIRRTSVLSSGLITVLLYSGFTYTGWHLMIAGQQENEHWIYNLHILSASLFIFFIFFHIVLHIKLLPEKRKKNNKNSFPGVPAGTLKNIFIFNAIIQILILMIASIYQTNIEPYRSTAVVDNYELPYGNHRFRPSQTETTNNAFIDQRQIANSHRCLSCHKDISKQWLSSMHQQAASDPTYVTNINLLANNKGISATRYCEGCHAPVALLSGELSPGGKHGGIKNTAANKEGISCMSCHGIDSITNLKGVASFKFKPAKDYLFSQSTLTFLIRIHDLLIRVKPDQHKRDLSNSLFQDSKFCSSCHTQFMDKDMNNWGWVQMQDEYAAWLKSPYSKQHREGFSNAAVSRCQDCHMPLIDSNDPSADINGKIRSHNFPGANTFMPILRNDEEQLAATIQFLQSNKMRVSIDKPNRKDALQNLQALDESLRNFEEAPYYFYLGETAEIFTIISNRGVGHNFPAGSIDINQAWVEFLVMDAEGRLVYSSGLINNENYVDPKSHFYRSLPIDRNGKLVWKHDLFNMAGESFKRVIKAGESDIVPYHFIIPSWAKSPLTVTSTLKYRKLNERYARWALKNQYIKIPVVNIAWDSLSIPIKIRKEVE